jgi:hypothetical protein
MQRLICRLNSPQPTTGQVLAEAGIGGITDEAASVGARKANRARSLPLADEDEPGFWESLRRTRP